MNHYSVAIYCVNYNSYDSLKHYLASIDTAAEKAKDCSDVSVFIADNSIPASPIDYQPRHFTMKTFPTGDNKGYFGAINYLMKRHAPTDYDFAVISNVDLSMSDDFFISLSQQSVAADTGWIAPQIYSCVEQRDRNPKIMRRYTKRKLQILKAKFHYPLLNWLYNHTLYRSKKYISHKPGQIYAGHGSFIILTRQYFERCNIIDYPIFLFCEEIYLAEQCLQHHLTVYYCPDIKVTDMEHASTNSFRRSRYCRFNYEALSYILKRYYA